MTPNGGPLPWESPIGLTQTAMRAQKRSRGGQPGNLRIPIGANRQGLQGRVEEKGTFFTDEAGDLLKTQNLIKQQTENEP
jgi:hypothetical protein